MKPQPNRPTPRPKRHSMTRWRYASLQPAVRSRQLEIIEPVQGRADVYADHGQWQRLVPLCSVQLKARQLRRPFIGGSDLWATITRPKAPYRITTQVCMYYERPSDPHASRMPSPEPGCPPPPTGRPSQTLSDASILDQPARPGAADDGANLTLRRS